MRATISWWNLDGSNQTIDSMRRSLNEEGVEAWETLSGMHAKFWISDPVNNCWGAIILWTSVEAMQQKLPPNRAAELIGCPPHCRALFDVEAIVERGHDTRAAGGALSAQSAHP